MSGRRFFQRGHASVPAAALSTGFSSVSRWRLVAAAAFAAAILLGWFVLSDWLRGADTDNPAASTPRVGERAMAASPSIIDTALAKVDNASRSFEAEKQLSGLTHHALSDEGIQRVKPLLGQAEARLIAIYQLISEGAHREALVKAEQLVRDHPNFHLAHLVHGDLLSLQIRPVRHLGDVPDTTANAAAQQLATLRDESNRRLRALTERPPEGAVPSQFLSLSPQSRHAIAIDASRSRLYLFENLTPSAGGETLTSPPKLKLLGDFYISVGLSGIEKSVEGDKRTPLGVYYITSTLNPDSLPDLYGVGALPINYPNPLDQQRGKTGSGIWLHGTPREQFVRAPQASDGCVVLSNPDLERLLATVQIRTTPVVIAAELQWVQPETQEADRRAFAATLEAWRVAKSEGRPEQLRAFYAGEMPPAATGSSGTGRSGSSRGNPGIELKDVSMLRWQDSQDTMVVTFGELPQGQSRGVTRRQYWSLEGGQWKIFHEGTP